MRPKAFPKRISASIGAKWAVFDKGFSGKGGLEIEKLCKKESRRLKTPQNWEAEPRVKYENNKDVRGKPTDSKKNFNL